MNRKIIQEMSFNALFMAIVFLMSFIPNIGYITIGILSLTIIPSLIMVASFLKGFKTALILSVTLGLSSWFVAFTRGSSWFDLLFIYPQNSLLPRLIWGLALGGITIVINKYPHLKKNHFFLGSVSFICSLLHTVLVLAILVVFNYNIITEHLTNFYTLFAIIIPGVGLAEALLATIIVPLIYYPLDLAYKRRRNLNG